MAKKRKHARDDGSARSEPNPRFASPFKDLKKLLAGREIKPTMPKPPPGPASPPMASDGDDVALLREAYQGVRPLDARSAREPMAPRVNHTVVSEDAEVIAQLSDLVSGLGRFDVTETEEYVEGARVDLDPRLVARLRRGEFAWQAHLDLHGMVQAAAKEQLAAFVIDSVRKGRRAVLIVTGRGLRSPGGQPVLKHAAVRWLSHGTIGGHVLAFTSARSADGGAGALYVMLRRERRRAPFDVLLGAKRRE